jgi:hypothetical protein
VTFRYREDVQEPTPIEPRGIEETPTHPVHSQPHTPAHSGLHTIVEPIPLTLTLFAPDGEVFTAEEVTLADLRKYRDLRGLTGRWAYKLDGESRHYRLVPELFETVSDPRRRSHRT